MGICPNALQLVFRHRCVDMGKITFTKRSIIAATMIIAVGIAMVISFIWMTVYR